MVIAPVTLRNRLLYGEWVPITVSGGQVLYLANNPWNSSGDLAPVPFVRPNSAFERVDFHRAAESATGRRMTPAEVSAYWRTKSVEFMLERPVTLARMVGFRLLRFWNAFEPPDNHSIEVWKRLSWVLRLPLPGYWLIAPFALVGLVLLIRRWHDLLPLYLTLVLYLVSLLPFWISSRYRLPIVGVLILFAAAAMVELRRRVSTGQRLVWAPAAMGLLAACLFCWMPLPRPDSGEMERNLAYAYEQTGQYEDAVAIYQALRQRESNPNNELFLANALGRSGKVEEATKLLQRLSSPEQPREVRRRAYNFSGDLARHTKQWAVAERAYRQALMLDGSDIGAWNNLGIALVGQQRHGEALEAFKQARRQAPDDMLSKQNLAELERYLAGVPNGKAAP
jgi:tetratricopeptide (TPR) repeat protein